MLRLSRKLLKYVHLANTFQYVTLLKHHRHLMANVHKPSSNYITQEFSATDAHEF